MSSQAYHILYRIGSGYSKTLLSLFRLIGFLGFIGAVGFIFTFPLWYWALHATRSFTVFMLLLLSLSLLYLIVRKTSGFIKQKRKEGNSYLKILEVPLLKGGRIVLLFLFIYFVASLAVAAQLLASLLVAIIGIVLLGFLFFTR